MSYLIEYEDTTIQADHWIAYRLAFEGDERIVGLANDETFHAHLTAQDNALVSSQVRRLVHR